jgi:4-amino-4-deoxy-L-arabinose transferase-like glycosyltransferase
MKECPSQQETAFNCTGRRMRMPLQFWLITFGVLAVVFALQVTSAVQESQTHDEAAHIAAGYSYWTTGDFRLNPEHPPLSKLLASLPLLLFRPTLTPAGEDWQRADAFAIGKKFLYKNDVPAGTLLLASRLVTMVIGLVLILSIGWWTARTVSPVAGLAALLLFAFEPSVIAHSRYVTSDVPVALFIWLSCISWYSYLNQPNPWALMRTGILIGCAIATKFNGIIVFPIFALVWLAYRSPARSERCARTASILLGVSGVVVLSVYFFDTRAIAEDPVLSARIEQVYPHDGSARSRVLQAVLHAPIPGYYFLRGLHLLIRHNQSGHLAYLMGSIYDRGSWLYFPVAFVVKSSVAWILLLISAVLITIRQFSQHDIDTKQQRVLVSLIVPVVVYLGVSLTSSINIGIRHLLPVYPFISAFIAIVICNAMPKLRPFQVKAAAALLFLFVVESCLAYPHYVSFFNAAAGSALNGHKFLLDSNLDWGQDLLRLRTWVERNEARPLCLSYFGTAEPAYYGIEAQSLASVRSENELADLTCVVAISAEHHFGLRDDPFAALRSLNPTDRVGHSIYIYDLRKR